MRVWWLYVGSGCPSPSATPQGDRAVFCLVNVGLADDRMSVPARCPLLEEERA